MTLQSPSFARATAVEAHCAVRVHFGPIGLAVQGLTHRLAAQLCQLFPLASDGWVIDDGRTLSVDALRHAVAQQRVLAVLDASAYPPLVDAAPGSEQNALVLLERAVMGELLRLHTGVVALAGAALARQGTTLLLVGSLGVGKTSLALGLMAHGWYPLGFDTILVDQQTLGVPLCPRPVHMPAVADMRVPAAVRAMLRAVGRQFHWPGQPPGYAWPRQWLHTGWVSPSAAAAAAAAGQPTILIAVMRDQASGRPPQLTGLVPLSKRSDAVRELAQALADSAFPVCDSLTTAHRLIWRLLERVTGCFVLYHGEFTMALDAIERACGVLPYSDPFAATRPRPV